MTNEQHIENLKKLKSFHNGSYGASVNAAIKALRQEPCEDEYIKVPKKALKYRTAGMVAYNVEWLKNHFDIERAVICGAQEPCEDATLKDIFCMGCEYKEQEPKTGKWIVSINNLFVTCSNCSLHEGKGIASSWNYCPNCGAKMEVSE